MRGYKYPEDIVEKVISSPEKRKFVGVRLASSVNYDTLDPYLNWRTILYLYDESSQSYSVTGYITYTRPYNLLLQVNQINLEPLPFETQRLNDVFDYRFYIPSMNSGVKGNSNLDVAIARTSAILSSNYAFNCNGPDEVASYILVACASTPAFEPRRLKYEKTRFLRRFTNVTESGFQKLLEFNGGGSVEQVSPSLTDRVRFYNHINAKEVPPQIWYRVSFLGLSHLPDLPLYAGNWTHLSFMEMSEWLWLKMKQRDRKRRNQLLEKPIIEPLGGQLELLRTHIGSQIRYSPETGKGNDKSYLIDLEDLPNMLPRCTRALVTQNRFPLDAERVALVPILQRGQIADTSIEALLEKLNKMFPHETGAMTTRRRWDYKSFLAKRYAAASCENLPSCMQCPYNGKKEMCLKDFAEKWPEYVKHDQYKYFWGPSKWLEWIFYWKNRE